MASIFTKIIDGEIPSHRVYEDEAVYAFLDIHPIQPGHTLVVPRREIPYLFDLPPDDYAALWSSIRHVGAAIEAATGCERIAVIVVGYDVPHAHVHLIPTDATTAIPFPEPIDQSAEQLSAMAERIAEAAAAARPDYGPKTALIVVDVQNDFADPAGSLAVGGAEEAIPAVNRQIAAARRAGATVAYTQDWHPAETPHFADFGGAWPVHCVAESWGAQFHPDLTVHPDAVFIRKGTGGEDGYSGFAMEDVDSGERSSTGLDEELRRRGIEGVFVAGLATDYCVKATALDALRLGYDTAVLADCVRAVDLEHGDGNAALGELRDLGARVI
jgi:nicotinamidase/pyrazinamidase